MEEATRTFETLGKNGEGTVVWEPEFTTPIIMRICRALQLTVGDLDERAVLNLPVVDMFRALWFSVASQASGLGINEESFYELLPPGKIMAAILVLKNVASESFPQLAEIEEEGKVDEETTPLDPGD